MRAALSSTSESHHSGQLPLTLRSDSAARTRKLGEALGELLQPGDILLLTGDLGAGKTTLTQGIGAGMGVRSVINSPTFTLLKEHDGRLPLHHFDLYRLDSPNEIYTLGFDEYFQSGGVSIVEWAERGEPQEPGELPPWPENALRIQITATGPRSRLLRLSASGARGAELARAWVHASSSGEG
jgi:tRNA threonylcarbamoyladenosine biosynthesis protein TsaE